MTRRREGPAARTPGPPPRTVRAAHRRRAVGALALAVAAASWSACGRGEAPSDAGRPGDLPERRVLADAWDTVFRVGGRHGDTLFHEASRIGADDGGLSLVDRFSGRVMRFDTAGRLQWRYGGRGGGPDEFRRPRDLVVDDRGRTWVLDALNARVTVLGPGGRPEFRVPLDRLEHVADGMAPLGGDRSVILTLGGEEPFVAVDRAGRVEATWPVPWAGYRELNPMATQMELAGRGDGRWASGFSFGDRFFLFGDDGRATARGWLPEPVAFPRVSVTRSGSGPGRRSTVTKLERPVFGTVDATLSGRRLHLLFGGTGPGAGRWVDGYGLEAGRYAGSYLLPRAVSGIAWGAGGFFVTYSDPFPTIALWRPRGEAVP